ncbi:hypothetical protein BOSEA31B_11118 [Hyphomicrobiales bacterium]|nr:hypothetical protein BOSEA31B_11118 [Hyphomicrobiales bacterium]CAH1700969.1 hypothetical protein BOSEA1005_20668 [Hyphomicrobiales bacterium]CAI0344847.1 hypothetical protein BO1005MUT1_350214 [Hyphomicrobiales bacterium]
MDLGSEQMALLASLRQKIGSHMPADSGLNPKSTRGLDPRPSSQRQAPSLMSAAPSILP